MPTPEHYLACYLYAGVTTIVGMGDDPKALAALEHRVSSGALPGPRMVFAGLPITKRGGHPTGMFREVIPWPLRPFAPSMASEIDGPNDAEAAVDANRRAGAGLIKVVIDDFFPGSPKLSEQEVAAIVRAAHARGLKVAAHVATATDAMTALRAGVDVLNHVVHRGSLSDADARALARAKIAVSPTLVVFLRATEGATDELRLSDLDRVLMPRAIQESLRPAELRTITPPPRLLGWIQEVHESWSVTRENVARLHRAGVEIITGTDSSLPANMAGAALHEEMRLLVEAGVPSFEVLLGATSRPARLFFGDPDFGTIEVGKVADLVLVEGDPLEDIRATAQIREVIQGGAIIERSTGSGR
jgi:imidazolonepropionase-like amidohydrolase